MARTVKVRLSDHEEVLLKKKVDKTGQSMSAILKAGIRENTIDCTIVYKALIQIDSCLVKGDISKAREENRKLCQIIAHI